jgi:hypothetical protein
MLLLIEKLFNKYETLKRKRAAAMKCTLNSLLSTNNEA